MTTTIKTHGMTIRTASQRTFVVVAGRPEAGEFKVWTTVVYDENNYPISRPGGAGYEMRRFDPFIEIVARSDSYATAKKRAEKFGRVTGGFVVIVDTRTGEEV